VTAGREDRVVLPDDRAARLAGVSVRRLHYWEQTGLVHPSTSRRLGPASTVRLFTFTDLLQLLVVAELRDRLPLQHIRRVVDHLRDRGYDAPLRQLVFATVGKELYFQHPDGTWEGGLAPDQVVFHQVIELEPLRRRIHRARHRPADDAGGTERARGRLGSKEVFTGTRIPVAAVLAYLDHGFTDTDVLREYPDLTQADIETARRRAV
jgi:DNA-binding transcriptional MerR regulator